MSRRILLDKASELDVLAECCWMAAEELGQRPKGVDGRLAAEASYLQHRLVDLARDAEKRAIELTDEPEG